MHLQPSKVQAIPVEPSPLCLLRYAEECQTQEGGWGLDGVLRNQAWKLRGRCHRGRRVVPPKAGWAGLAGWLAGMASLRPHCAVPVPNAKTFTPPLQYPPSLPTAAGSRGLETHITDWCDSLWAGVVNGIDGEEWDPAVDAFLRSDGYVSYTMQVRKRCGIAHTHARRSCRFVRNTGLHTLQVRTPWRFLQGTGPWGMGGVSQATSRSTGGRWVDADQLQPARGGTAGSKQLPGLPSTCLQTLATGKARCKAALQRVRSLPVGLVGGGRGRVRSLPVSLVGEGEAGGLGCVAGWLAGCGWSSRSCWGNCALLPAHSNLLALDQTRRHLGHRSWACPWTPRRRCLGSSAAWTSKKAWVSLWDISQVCGFARVVWVAWVGVCVCVGGGGQPDRCACWPPT